MAWKKINNKRISDNRNHNSDQINKHENDDFVTSWTVSPTNGTYLGLVTVGMRWQVMNEKMGTRNYLEELDIF